MNLLYITSIFNAAFSTGLSYIVSNGISSGMNTEVFST